MFGLSLSKLLVLAAVIAAVWYGFKWISRMDKMRKEEAERDRLDNSKRRAEADRASAAPTPAAAQVRSTPGSCGRCGLPPAGI